VQKRIILTSNYSPWSSYSGGGQRSTHHIATELSNLGFDVHVVFTKTWFEKVSVPKSISYKVHWSSFPGFYSKRTNLFRFLSGIFVKNIVGKLLTRDCIVHSNGEEGSFIGSLKKTNSFKFVITPRYPFIPEKSSGLTPTSLSALMNWNHSKYVMLHKALLEADIICPTSKFSKNMFRNLFALSNKRFNVVYNGVSEDFFNASQKKTNTNTIIFFGRLSASKGVDTLLKASEIAHANIDKVIIIGRGELKEFASKKATSGVLKDKIELYNWLDIPELIKQIQVSTLAVLPSREESFGNSVAEAMACGVATITTRVGSIPELIEKENQGILLDPENISGFADAITSLILNPKLRQEIALNGKNRIHSTFSWKSSVQNYLAVYNS
tara:strand:+ start:6307 stop:7455 length:1149 start_codon:yes stop_codon:yes gene_type:complete